MGIAACIILAAADAAWRMLGKVTTATDVSSGRTASLSVATRIKRRQFDITQYELFYLSLTFCNNTESSLRTNKEAVEIIPRRRLARSPTRLDSSSIRQDNGQIDHPVLHGAISYSVSSGAVGANHTSNLSSWTCESNKSKSQWLEYITKSRQMELLEQTGINRKK